MRDSQCECIFRKKFRDRHFYITFAPISRIVVQRWKKVEPPKAGVKYGRQSEKRTLSPEFWDGKPEIRDERLVAWLESKQRNGKLASKPAPVVMIPSGEHAFRLLPIEHREVRTTKYPVGFSA